MRRIRFLLVGTGYTLLGGLVAQAQPANEPLEKFIVTDGIVNAMAKNGNGLYLGGAFTQAGARTGGGVPVSVTTGQADAVFPTVNGSVYAVTVDGHGGWFIGGRFSVVGGFVRTNLAQIRSDRTVDPNWCPSVSGGYVVSLALAGNTVYAGGTFTNADGQTRNFAAGFDGATGAMNNWNPNANSTVRAIVPYGTNVYLGGEYTQLSNQGRTYLAAVDPLTGEPSSWNPGASDVVEAMVLAAGHLYVAGNFTSIMSASRGRAASFDLATGLLDPWNPNVNGIVYAVDAYQGIVYLGGSFSTVGTSTRQNLAAVDAVSGLVTTWDAHQVPPPGYIESVYVVEVYSNALYVGGSIHNLGGPPRANAGAVDLTVGNATAWDPKANLPVFALCGSGTSMFMGGNFGAVGCVPRGNLAAFDLLSGQVTSWNPVVIGRGGSAYPVQALAIASNQVFVGGYFTNVGGATRTNLASVDLQTGAVSDWTPNANATIDALATWNDRLFVGGTAFSSISGQPRANFAEFYLGDLSLTSWDPQIQGFVRTFLVDGDTLYVGGYFSTISGVTQRRIAAFDLTTDTMMAWNPNITGSYVSTIAKYTNQVYLGGFFSVVNGSYRTNVVAVDAATADVLPLVANADSFVYGLAVTSNQLFIAGNFLSVNGQTRSCLAAVDANTGAPSGWNPSAPTFAYGLNLWDGVLYAYGSFFRLGGETTASIGAFPVNLVGLPDIVRYSTRPLAGGAVQFRVTAVGVPEVTVQFSSDLFNWQPLQTIPLYAGNGIFTDAQTQGHTTGFYRLSVP